MAKKNERDRQRISHQPNRRRSSTLTRALIFGVGLGSLYGLCLRLLFGRLPAWATNIPLNRSASLVMTAAFLIFVPIAIGYLTIGSAGRFAWLRVWQWIFVPWIPIILSTCIAALMNWEGMICIVFALPITLTFASVGGVVAGLLARHKRTQAGFLTARVAFLPLLVAPVESWMDAPIQHRRVATQVAINAPAQVVWANIERVRRIDRSESPPSWTQKIGFLQDL